MVLFVTAVCNARCEFCFYWEEIESANAKLELTLEEYQKISRHLHHLYYLSIGGGEPFIRKDLTQIIEAFYQHSQTRTVALATHGGFSDRAEYFLNTLHQHCPDLRVKIQVSIDHLYEKHDQSRKVKGLFNRLLETCRMIGGKKKSGMRVMLTLGTVLTPENKNDIQKMRDFFDQHIPYDDLSLIYPRGEAKNPSLLQVTLQEYRSAQKIFDATHSNVNFYTKLHRQIDKEGKKGVEEFIKRGKDGYPWTCVAGRKMITLFERGNVSPCEMLHQIMPQLSSGIGNVREYDYDIPKMLKLDQAKKIREFIVNTHCSCSYECAALCNTALNKKQWPQLAVKALLS